MNKITNAVRQLHQAGAHLLRCRPDKSSLGRWKHHPASEQDCTSHTDKGGLVGIVPGSIGAVVVDIDSGTEDSMERVEAVVKQIGLPVCLHHSSKNYKYHLWYRWGSEDECKNHSWNLQDTEGKLMAAGELRCTNGYVVLWDPNCVADHVEALRKAEPVDLTPLLGETRLLAKAQKMSAVNLGTIVPHAEVTYDKVEELLDQIDPDVDYQTWIMVGAAIQSKFPYDDGLHLWDNWSGKGEKYEPDGPNSPREKWGTFDPEGEVTIGTLFHYASLSETTPEIPPAAHVASVIQGAPQLPAGYKKVKVLGRTVIQQTVRLEGGKVVDVTVSDFDIYPVSYGMDEALGYETVRYKWERPHVGWSDLTLRIAHLNQGSREFPMAISDQMGIALNKDRLGAFQKMLNDFMKKMQESKTVTPLFNTMGWKQHNTAFVLGQTLMRRDDKGKVVEEQTSFSGSIRKEKLRAFSCAGDVNTWKETTGIIAQGGLPLHGFAIGVGLSAPLYAFSGLKGLVVSLYGETGGGKSLAQYWAQSVWGNPEALHIKANHTTNALYHRMGMHCNLPVTIDEVTMMLDKEVGNFCFNVSQGSDKMRLNKNSEESETNTWATPVLVSTNKSLQSKLTASGLETDAQLARLFEINVNPHPLFVESSDLGGLLYKSMVTHHGHAGHQFIRNLLAIPEEELVTMLEANRLGLGAKYGIRFKGDERFWEQMLNMADFALSCALQWGLIAFDPEYCLRWVVQQVSDNRDFSKEVRMDSFDILGQYLSDFSALAVSVFHTRDNGKVDLDTNRIPRDTIRIRYDLYRERLQDPFVDGVLSIDRSHFKTWLASRGADYTTFKKEMRAESALIGPTTDRGSLGKNTSIRLKQATIFRFDLTHPNFVAMVENLGKGDMNLKED